MQQLNSAGGVVVAHTSDGPRIAVLHHLGFDEWRLPKGKLHYGESSEQAAVREVTEELGVTGTIVRELGGTGYTYQHDGEPIHKLVVFYLMTAPTTSTSSPEPATFDEVRWLPFNEAAARLTWDNEREMVLEAQPLVP